MSQKDNWDKFDILFKAFVLGLIPLVIKFGADNIAQSLKQGELVQSMIADLMQDGSRKDLALIALDGAIPPRQKCYALGMWCPENDPDNDQVVGVARIVLRQSSEKARPTKELTIIQEVITRRAGADYYRAVFNQLAGDAHSDAISKVNAEANPEQAHSKAALSEALAIAQPQVASSNTKLTGVRLVYIQYNSNVENAKKMQKELQDQGIAVPGVQRVSGIRQNDIRYANKEDEEVARRLQKYLEGQGIAVEKLIDLSDANYKVQSGQVEIWLKD